jgi:hypothetical protein
MWSRTQQLAKSLDSRYTGGAIASNGRIYGQPIQQDVFCFNDYNVVKDSKGIQWPTLRPPLTNDSKAYLVTETIGCLSGPIPNYQREDSVWDQQSQAIAHAIVQNIGLSNVAYCGVVGYVAFDYTTGRGHYVQGEFLKANGVLLFRILF